MKRSLVTTFIFLAFFAFISNLNAQILEPVKWKFSKEKLSDNEYKLIFKASIDEHWHLYSQHIEDYPNPPATAFTFDGVDRSENPDNYKGDGFDLAGPVEELSKVKRVFDKNFDKEIAYFSNEAIFAQTVKITTNKPVTIKGFVEYMSCDDSRCLPPGEEEFSFYFNGAKANTQVAASNDNNTKQDITENSDVPATTANSHASTAETGKSLWGFFITAIIAGLLGILTPCVFPMIPMTVSFFMNDTKSKTRARMEAIVYGISIIAIYTIVGVVVAIIAGPEIANWLSTHWIPNILFFLVFLIFAFSFFGMFEITLPSWVVNKADKQADKGGFLGSFFMALTLVLVSFSCTGPLVGSILVESAGGQLLKPIVGMLGFSLAFALPFTFFAFMPKLLGNLPRSGGWLNSVKVVLGFLELALGLKFLSIADQTYHWHILDREVYLALWIVIFSLMGIYLLGKIKFNHDSDIKFLSVPRLVLAIITFSFVVYMIPGMFGAPLKVLSGYLPPQQSLDFDLNKIVRENVKLYSGNGNGSGTSSEICETPKYADFLHLPHGLEGYFDYKQALACAKKQNKPIFIDFTGHGCVNCREMEANVWSNPEVLKRLRQDYIVTALYVDDKTRLPESEWYTSSYDNKVKNSIGKQNADFQITKYGVNAQPYYVLVSPNGELLAKPRAYDLNVQAFVEWLDCGLEYFNAGKTYKE
ncbi:MAG: cytochrome c biogenesis protein CcdA [Bacteroidales bacterium]